MVSNKTQLLKNAISGNVNKQVPPVLAMNNSLSNLKVERFKDGLPLTNSNTVIHEQTSNAVKSLIAKIKSAKIFQISFVGSKNKNINISISNKNQPISDIYIENYLSNLNITNISPNHSVEAIQAANYYYDFARTFRDLCENGFQDQIDSLLYSFYSPNNPYNAYFRGEIYNLIKTIHQHSNHNKNISISPKEFAYRIYKLLDPSFDCNSLDNLYSHDSVSGLNVNFFQKTHELLDAIDLARSSDVEIHMTNDNDWNSVLLSAGIDQSYKQIGNLTQKNTDLLIVDRKNKLFYGVDLKTRFWLNGFSPNKSLLFNLGNVPESERNIISAVQKTQILNNLKLKLSDPNLTKEHKKLIIDQISFLSKNEVPYNTYNAMLPHINPNKSNAAVSAVLYSTGKLNPDRPNESLGLGEITNT